jgi:chromate transporter
MAPARAQSTPQEGPIENGGTDPRRQRLGDLALVFLRLGTIAFGGPAAHIALMEREFVTRYGWLTKEEFLDLVGAASLIPGPSSTEVAIYVGYRRAGFLGLLIAGSCFILPAAVMVAAIAWVYVNVGQLPQVGAVLHGVKAVVIPIIAQALVSLSRTAVKTKGLLALGLMAVAASALGVNPLVALLGAGVLNLLWAAARRPMTRSPAALLLGAGGIAAGSSVVPVSLVKLFLVFLKIGAVVFGSGYVLLAFLRADFVGGTHWLTEAQLLDAVAVGQVTPGPVFTTATFIGYVVAGPLGAAVATLGIFLPSFVLVAASGPLIPRLRRSPLAAAFMDGANVAAVGVILVVGVELARTALVDVTTILLAALGFVALVRLRLNSAWLVAAGALVGLAQAWLT